MDIAPRKIPWRITRQRLPVPSQKGTLTQTGSNLQPSWSNYDSTKLTIGGTTGATSAGTYSATFTPKANFEWEDGTTTAKTVSWTIGQPTVQKIGVPTQSGILTYTGSSKTPSWSNYNSNQLTIGGTTAGTSAGTYTATFAPKTGFAWTDGTTTSKNVTWTIGRATTYPPYQTGTLTYTGSSQSPTWSGYNTSQMTIGGTRSATSVGTYNATFTPTANYKWSDGTTASKNVAWSIQEAKVASVPTQKGSLTFTGSVLTPQWNNYNTAQLTIGGTTSSSAPGTHTASFTPKTNYIWFDDTTASKNATWTIGAKTSWTPAEIQTAVKAGNGPNIWMPGDEFPVSISGTLVSTSISGSYKLIILGLNHNSSREGNNTMHVMLGKNSAGVNIAFCESQYGIDGTTAGFRMTLVKNNAGGWKSSYMRTTVMPQCVNLLPSSWRNIITACTKYSDNAGGDTPAVSSTSDQAFLPSEFEAFGNIQSLHVKDEATYQKQYDYFKNTVYDLPTNSYPIRTAYKHNSTSTDATWWLRTPWCNASGGIIPYGWTLMQTKGGDGGTNGQSSRGIRPCFKVS